MKRLLLWTFVFSCLWCQQASAAISAVTLGTHHSASASTNPLTTVTNDCPVGSTIFVFTVYTTITDTLSSVSDSGGNTYQTPIDNVTVTGVGIGIAYAKNTTVDIPIGGTITATFGGPTISNIQAACISNGDPVAPLDTSGHTATGTVATTATTVNSGTLGNATAVVFGVLGTGGSISSITCGGSFASLVTVSSIPSAQICSQVVSSTASVAFAPTWTTNANYVTDILSFQGVSVKSPSMLTTGIGP